MDNLKFVGGRKFALLPDERDERDIIYQIHHVGVSLPETTERKHIKRYFDLYHSAYDQGNEGACAAFSYLEACRVSLLNNNHQPFNPSAQFAYYVARTHKNIDEGLMIRNLLKAMVKYGVCSENLWKYSEGNFS